MHLELLQNCMLSNNKIPGISFFISPIIYNKKEGNLISFTCNTRYISKDDISLINFMFISFYIKWKDEC